jgi:major vault protein
LFSVKDFVGDACKSIASRVRGAVSSITFEDFHHNSSLKIRESVFGRGSDGNIRNELVFNANNLVITSVDI